MDQTFKNKLLSLYPNFDKVTGPYSRKDGRQHICLNNSTLPKGALGKLKTLSWPKAIIEVTLGRVLTNSETVDHIDKNPLNNAQSNLQVLSRQAHCSLDAKRRKPVIVNCTICNSEFEATRDQLRKDKTGYFCSKKCSGTYGAEIQQGKRNKEPLCSPNIEYFSNKTV